MNAIDLMSNLEKPVDLADPLPEHYPSPKFPIDALGPILGEAAKRLAYHVQVPEGMAGQSVLATAALIAQAHINVQRGLISIGPVSLFFLSVAESGDRKSTVDRLALAPVRDYENKRLHERKEQEKCYKIKLETWEMRRKTTIESFHHKKDGMTPSQQDELSKKLFELETQKPKSPPRSNIIFSEPTPEGIWKHYFHGEPSAGLFSDEGISFFSGHGMNDESKGRTISMLSKLWDGDPLSRTRGAEGESGILSGRRLSAHLMVQPVVAAKVIADPLLQGQGFLARFLICHEPSIAGTRFLDGRDRTKGAQNDPILGQYWDKITQLLSKPVNIDSETGELKLHTSSLTGEALKLWCVTHDLIEAQIKADGRFRDVKAFASKAAENAARIAAILAFVEGYEHPTAEHIKRTSVLISYYLESMAIRTLDSQQDLDAVHARDLLDWIKNNSGVLIASDFNRLPSACRGAKKARKLLAFLVVSGHLRIAETNTQSGKPSAWKLYP